MIILGMGCKNRVNDLMILLAMLFESKNIRILMYCRDDEERCGVKGTPTFCI